MEILKFLLIRRELSILNTKIKRIIQHKRVTDRGTASCNVMTQTQSACVVIKIVNIRKVKNKCFDKIRITETKTSNVDIL
jgi:hypothetical protein